MSILPRDVVECGVTDTAYRYRCQDLDGGHESEEELEFDALSVWRVANASRFCRFSKY